MEWSIKGCNKLETVMGRHKCMCLRHLQGFVVLPESLLSNWAKNFKGVAYIINTPEAHDKMFIWDDLWWARVSVPHCIQPPGHHEDLASFLLCGYDITLLTLSKKMDPYCTSWQRQTSRFFWFLYHWSNEFSQSVP